MRSEYRSPHSSFIMARVFVGVGSNINPEANIRDALSLLAERARITGISTFYRTDAEDRPGQPPFYNGVVEIETDTPPAELKHSVLCAIESRLGRVRSSDKYAPRTIDLDILIYDDLIIRSDDLVIPDPQIQRRAFLAIPLCELAPDSVLPGSGKSVCEIAGVFADHGMEVLREFTDWLRKEFGIGR